MIAATTTTLSKLSNLNLKTMATELIQVLTTISKSLEKANRIETKKLEVLRETARITQEIAHELRTIQGGITSLDDNGIVIHAEMGGVLVKANEFYTNI